MNNLTLLTFQSLTLEESMKKIRDNNFIDNVYLDFNKLLTQLGSTSGIKEKINIKKILSAFLIFYHKDEMLNTTDQYSEKMFELSRNLIFIIDKIARKEERYNIKEFLISLNTFINFFDVWKNRDSLILVRPLIATFIQLSNEKRKDEKEEDEYNNILTNIKKKVFTIAGNLGLSYLEKGEVPYFMDEKIFQDIELTVKQAFWDVFEENIKEKKFEVIVQILSDLKNMIFDLVSERNRKDFLKEFDEKLDLNLLEKVLLSMKENDDLKSKNEFIKSIGILIIHYIKMFQAPEDDTDTKLFEENFINKINSEEQPEKILRFFFKTSFDKVEKISYITRKIKERELK